ncbi:MAG: LUD domain-containing protein [Sporocytophaga sp.]|uniref:LUD domain-containing protein n=1 Tax=Sporocytophaga sp. TaxID=2231183 RepID=UPI001B0834AF|nr:LUD domain-containing protein [Sporocytophaga sp.]MBO9699661.1 LUD domain-containing protein [Sporocytophaga sp.]
MGFNLSKDKIFNKIRSASSTVQGAARTPDFSSPIYSINNMEDWGISFAEKFTQAGGTFIYCESTVHFQNALVKFVKQKKNSTCYSAETLISEMAGDFGIKCQSQIDKLTDNNLFISSCESLLAESGSIIVSSNQQQIQSPLYFHSNIHIIIAFVDQILLSRNDGIRHLEEKYQKNSPSLISIVTGSKSSSNAEQRPKEVVLFLIDETDN